MLTVLHVTVLVPVEGIRTVRRAVVAWITGPWGVRRDLDRLVSRVIGPRRMSGHASGRCFCCRCRGGRCSRRFGNSRLLTRSKRCILLCHRLSAEEEQEEGQSLFTRVAKFMANGSKEFEITYR